MVATMNRSRLPIFSPFVCLAALLPAIASAQELLPARTDAATKGTFKLVDGTPDRYSAPLTVLNDGKGASDDDDPRASFFFQAGTDGGRISIDLGSAIPVKSVTTTSQHSDSRAPQIYQLFASDGTAENFSDAPKRGTDPVSVGWKLIDSADSTKEKGTTHQILNEGFMTGVAEGKNPASYRYLLFDIKQTNPADPHSNTFFNEIDVVDATAPVEAPLVRKVDTVTSKDGKYKYVLDSTEAPDLRDWTLEKLFPVMEEWYPKIIAMLPVEGYTPTDTVYFALKNATELPGYAKGVPGYASGDRITLNASFIRDNKDGESIGCAVHEITHVVQFAGNPRPRVQRPPTWVFEGATDYIRWFLFEPESKGAEITKGNVGRSKYDDSYRVTANFMDWVIKNYDKDLMRKINLSIHTGYSEDLWKEWTGKTVQELGAEWKKANEERLGVSKKD